VRVLKERKRREKQLFSALSNTSFFVACIRVTKDNNAALSLNGRARFITKV
jgi:hypothetical protein